MKRRVGKGLKAELAKKHACYVLITCDAPSGDGKMQVEMCYKGDATLAAYILHGAQLHIGEQDIDGAAVSEQSKIHYFE